MPPRRAAHTGDTTAAAYYRRTVACKAKRPRPRVSSATLDPSRIRVLVTAFAPVPGSSPHSAAMLGMTGALRAEIDLVSLKTDAFPHVEAINGARMFRVPVGDADALEQRRIFDRAVARQLEAERYDVVHVRGPFEGALAAERKADLGFQLVYEMATFPDEALGVEVERRWGEAHALCLGAADRVIVPTEAARRAVIERVPEEHIVVVPPGVDLGAFDRQPAPQSPIARLVYLGAFTADRDLATLLGAVRKVHGTRPLSLLIAGEADRGRRARLRQMVEAFGLGDIVLVRGEPASRALPGIISSADLCLATASEDPRFQTLGDLPQPLLEYMACHRPVVAAGVPAVAEVLRDEQEGLLYPPGDESALGEAILEMLRDEGLRQRTTDAAYRRARELFSSGARRRRIQDAYEGLIAGSQTCDVWAEGFPDGVTGEHEIMPSSSGSEASAVVTGTGETMALDLDKEALEVDPAEVVEHVTTDAGRRAAEPSTTELELLPELDGEQTQAKAVALGTDPGSRVGPPTVDTDPGSRP